MPSKHLIAMLILVIAGGAVEAREAGHYVPGIANIRDFAVPGTPGFYYVQYNAFYTADTYRDQNGNSADAPDIEPEIDVISISPLFMWATEKEILGGRYGFYVAPSISKASISAAVSLTNPEIEYDDDTTGLGDTFVQPLWLGWSGETHDLSLGLGLYAPTGKYDADADDNIGLGFWTTQIQAAGYYYLDNSQAIALMTALTYETHGEKEGTDITPGDHATLELGYSQYLSDQLEFGFHVFRQWQTGSDDGSDAIAGSVKPEVTGYGLQIAYWTTPQLNLSFKYIVESDAEARLEGEWAILNLTYVPTPLF
ncbi:MAG: transporter [Gammaproteobacteria bacterium]|nr:transporter [Gammaproteobacteria bacterium]